MRLFFDESGTFSADRAETHRYAVVAGVAIPSGAEAAIASDFHQLRTQLAQHRGQRSELKGAGLTDEQRQQVCLLLDRHPRVLVRAIIFDVQQFAGGQTRSDLDTQLEQLATLAKQLGYKELAEESLQLYRRHGNLHPQQVVKAYGWANCVDRLLRDVAIEIVPRDETGAWRRLELVLDGRPEQLEAREGQFFSVMVQNWLVTWAQMRPYATVQLPGEPHPLVEHFGTGTPSAINIQNIVKQGLRFADSRDEMGLQLADVAAAIVAKVVRTEANDLSALRAYGWLMKSCRWVPDFGLGFVTPHREMSTRAPPAARAMEREFHWAFIRRCLDRGATLLSLPSHGEYPGIWLHTGGFIELTPSDNASRA